MSKPRIFLEPGEGEDEHFRLSGERAHYLSRVVRLRPGQRFLAVAADGCEIEAEVRTITRDGLEAAVLTRSWPQREPSHHLTLALAVLKAKAMDWAVQKTTEVGVATILPVLSSRVVVRGDARGWDAKRRRWQEIAREAARQSHRMKVPQVEQPITVQALAQRCRAGEWVLLDPAASPRPIAEAVSGHTADGPRGLIVGPEGDFDDAEKALLRQAGAVSVSIGPRVLRAETAAVVGCALILYLLGDMQ